MNDRKLSLRITVLNGQDQGVEQVLSENETLEVGRSQESDLTVGDITVSRQHCLILANDNGEFLLENKSSTRQTFLNGAVVSGLQQIHDGDLIQVGETRLMASMDDPEYDDATVATSPNSLDEDDVTVATCGMVDDEDMTSATIMGDCQDSESKERSAISTGQYTQLAEIDAGGQASIYTGCDASTGETVALKLFKHDVNDEVSESRFRREVEILEKVSHRNIVEYRGVYEEEGDWGDRRKYLVMELLKGQTLKEYVAAHKKGAPWKVVQDMLLQCLTGLIYAIEEHGIIHRDIKPSNIFILDDGSIKLIDFGIARMDSDGTHTGGSGMMGSFDYMAPDFALHKEPGFRGDEVSDVFSLFVCFYEMLTGSLPYPKFGERQELEFLTRWKEGVAAPSHSHITFRVISHLSTFVNRGLAVRRAERFQSFREVLEELQTLKNRIITHTNVERYMLLDGLGAGGFGEVYKARALSSNEIVAIKRLYSDRPTKRFIKEAAVLKKYRHPAIVGYLDFFETQTSSGVRNAVIVLEYLEGGTVNDLTRKNRTGLQVDVVLQLFLQYLAALDFIHNGNDALIHRDIKPANLHVPVEDPLKAKVFDMGIVRDVSGTKTSGTLPGTYYYMAPELFTTSCRGTPGTDVYALGLSLYEALTGKPAFPRLPKDDKQSILEMLARAKGEKNYNISFLPTCFKKCPELVDVIKRATHRDPAIRYTDAKSMWEDLAAVLVRHFGFSEDVIQELRETTLTDHDEGDKTRFLNTEAAPTVFSEFSVWRDARRKTLMAVGGIFVFALLGGGCFYGWSRYERRIISTKDAFVSYIADEGNESLQNSQRVTGAGVDNEAASVEAIAEPIVAAQNKDNAHKDFDEAKEECALALESKIRLITRDGIKGTDYASLVEDVAQRITSFKNTMLESEYAVCASSSELQPAKKKFWCNVIRYILEKIQRAESEQSEDYTYLSIARGVVYSALPTYEDKEHEGDVEFCLGQIYTDVQDVVDEHDPSLVCAEYLPVKQTRFFKCLEEDVAYLKDFFANVSESSAVILPSRATMNLKTEIEVGRGKNFVSSDLEFVLVPDGLFREKVGKQKQRKLEMSAPIYMSKFEICVENMHCYRNDAPRKTGYGQAFNGLPARKKLALDAKEVPYHPASVDEAVEFCNWLSIYDGLAPVYARSDDGEWLVDLKQPGYRLPTCDEWEYAARMGFDFYMEQGRETWRVMQRELSANPLVHYYWKQALRGVQDSVGQPAYPLGLYNMSGNAAELCMEPKVGNSYDRQAGRVGVNFMTMGGSLGGTAAEVMPWAKKDIKDEGKYVGFRVVRPVPITDL